MEGTKELSCRKEKVIIVVSIIDNSASSRTPRHVLNHRLMSLCPNAIPYS